MAALAKFQMPNSRPESGVTVAGVVVRPIQQPAPVFVLLTGCMCLCVDLPVDGHVQQTLCTAKGGDRAHEKQPLGQQ